MTTRSFPIRGVVLLSGAAALVGLGAGIVTLVPGVLSNGTSVDDVRVAEGVDPTPSSQPVVVAQGEGAVAAGIAESVEVDDSGTSNGKIHTVWVVPMNAPLSDFPLSSIPDETRSCLGVGPDRIDACLYDKKECTDEHLRWLEKHAYRTSDAGPDGVWLGVMQFRNAATTGNALTIKEVQPKGTFTPIPGNSFTLVCMPYFDAAIGAAAGSMVYRPTTVDLSGSGSAIFGEPSAFGEDPTADTPAGNPAVLNLEPGEAASLGVLGKPPVQAGAFTGQLEATVASGSDTETLPLEIDGQSTFTVAFASNTTARLQLHGGAMCPAPVERYPGTLKYQNLSTCTLDDFVREQNLG